MELRSVFWKSRKAVLIAGILLAIMAFAFFGAQKNPRPHLPASEESATAITNSTSSTSENTSTTSAASAMTSSSSLVIETNAGQEKASLTENIKTETVTSLTSEIQSSPTEIATQQTSPSAFSAIPTISPTPVPAPLLQEKSSNPSDSLLVQKIDFWIWTGLGVNYTSSTQTVDGFSNLEFGRIKSPSSMMRAGFYVSDKAGLELGFKSTPGEAKSSETVSVDHGEYTWLTMSAEGIYRTSAEPENSELTWRLGVQQHQVPFLMPAGANAVSLTNTSLTNLSLGFEYKKQLRKKLRFEWLMRYQYPIASGNNDATAFKVDPNISFDGSIGAAYQITDHTFVGVYWYGQYHDFAFSYNDPSTLQIEGRQSLFFTNFDLRLGWEF